MSYEVKVTKDLENKILTIEREFDAPREKVWKAYTDQETFEKWWGPEGWVTKTKEFNFVPNGRVHYDMKCVDESQGEWFGQSSWGVMLVETVNAPDNFTYRDYFSDETGALNETMPSMKVTNEFVEQDGVTKLVSRSFADSAEQIEQLLAMGMIEGFTSQLLRLDALLAE
jgi:uncharacterized protein YndB with AHSA1/START domain